MQAFNMAIVSKTGDRKINEDAAIGFKIGMTWFAILSDGLGGFEGGEMASKLVVDTIRNFFEQEAALSENHIKAAIETAQKALIEAQATAPEKRKMRATVVVLGVNAHQGVYGYTGDSRLYVYRHNQLLFRTKDHSVCQGLVQTGALDPEKIRFHEDKNRLLKVLGQDEGFDVTTGTIPMASMDRFSFLLCSDGVWDHVDTLDIEIALGKSATVEDWLKNIEIKLLLQARNNMDNYSMIALG